MGIRDHTEIRRQVQAALDHPGPLVCAVNVSSDQVTAPRATSSVRADGVIVSLPMEDMAPRLPREAFLSEMLIPPLAE
jgi:acetolactate synthase-1/2/3 large subunit